MLCAAVVTSWPSGSFPTGTRHGPVRSSSPSTRSTSRVPACPEHARERGNRAMHQSATDPRPRVLHVIQPVDGGAARVVTDLTRAQVAAGLHVTVACPDSPLTTALRALGADVRQWEAARSPGPSLAREVRRLAQVVEA